MENKKTFGSYIFQRRRELGMTQKDLAEKLYVTESAVSKWERGLSYPDITLLQNNCSVLQVTEHELLTGSEDTSRRVSEKLAEKYRKLTRNYRIAQYIIYGIILLGCGIGNLAARHTLDWFFIAAAAVAMAASLTLAPALAALGVLLGLGLAFLPVILRQTLRGLPLYSHKALLYCAGETVFLLLLLFVVALQNNLENFWNLSLPVALLCLALPWGIMGALRYLPANGWLKVSAASAWIGLWLWIAPAVFERIMLPIYGESDKPYSLLIPFDFTQWDIPHKAWNIIAIILLALGIIAAVCAVMGVRKRSWKK